MKKLWHLIHQTLEEARADNLPIFAAGFSYYLLFSIIPLIIVVLAIAGRIVETGSASNAVIRQLALLFDAETASSFRMLIVSAGQLKVAKAGTIGGILVFYGASRVFTVLQQAISQIWDKENKRRGGFRGAIYARVRSALLMMLPIVLVLICFIFDAFLSAFKHTLRKYAAGIGVRYILPGVSHILALLIFAAIFSCINKLLPCKKPSWKDVRIGAVVTTAAFALGKFIFTAVLHHAQIGSLFGAAGSLILILVWIYFSMLIFLYGSELTHVYTKKFGSWTPCAPSKAPL